MADIKTKVRGTVKTLDKARIQTERLKDNIVNIKDKSENAYKDNNNNSSNDYAISKIENTEKRLVKRGIEQFDKQGRKAVKDTRENIQKAKSKIDVCKNKAKKKAIEKKVKGTIKTKNTIKNVKTNIKTSKNTTTLAKKGIKTTEQVAKNTKKVAKESIKLSQRAARMTKRAIQTAIKTAKIAIKVTIKVIQAIIAATKAIISAIIAGGWVAVVIILVIVLIGGFIAVISNSDGDDNYDTSQIPNSEIILVAKAQIGNEGGDKFWKWYGFEEHVHWCACYVSWCANECGYIDKGIIPKFALCTDGINWFKEKDEWHDRGESYYPIIGDIIFFDWKDENGNQDGTSDHVGIVTRTDLVNRTIYTIEGNTNNKCAERMYSFEDVQVMGYGSPKYE